MGFVVRQRGNFNKTEVLLNRILRLDLRRTLERYGQEGVNALAAATPVDSGLTADCWYYEIEYNNGMPSIAWYNSNVNKHVNIAVILQMGHGTRNGGYVRGRDYINPAMQPVFDRIASDIWKEVTE